MIIAFAAWLIAFTAASGYGRLVMRGNSDSASAAAEFPRIYTGLLILSTILLAAAAFTNLTPFVGLIALMPGIVIWWRCREKNKPARRDFVILAFIAMFISTREIDFYDTALYHQQSVKWLAEHGLVRGVALVNFRFGFVSSWFALAAPLNHGVTVGRVGIIGGIPFVLAIFSGLQFVRGLLRRQPNLTTWAIFGLLLSVVAVIWHVDSSLSPDLMAWLLPLVIVMILADTNATEADRLGRATLVSAMACLMKSTVAPIFAYCFALLVWRFFRAEKDRRKLAVFAALALSILVLLFGLNLIASGCPLFPSPLGCVSGDWSVGADTARSIQAEIEQFARASRHHQIFPLTAAAAVASALFGAIVRTGHARHVLGVTWVGIAFTLALAPVPRYGLGYFLLPVAALIGAAIERVIPGPWLLPGAFSGWGKGPAFLGATGAIGSLIFLAAAQNWVPLLYPRRIAAANGDPIHIVNRAVDIRSTLAVRSEQLGEMTIWIPASSDQCWDAPLPCTPNLTRGDIRLRSKGDLNAGFSTPTKGLQALR
jgi:hypothetical protein